MLSDKKFGSTLFYILNQKYRYLKTLKEFELLIYLHYNIAFLMRENVGIPVLRIILCLKSRTKNVFIRSTEDTFEKILLL